MSEIVRSLGLIGWRIAPRAAWRWLKIADDTDGVTMRWRSTSPALAATLRRLRVHVDEYKNSDTWRREFDWLVIELTAMRRHAQREHERAIELARYADFFADDPNAWAGGQPMSSEDVPALLEADRASLKDRRTTVELLRAARQAATRRLPTDRQV
jgi:hypothetical protein